MQTHASCRSLTFRVSLRVTGTVGENHKDGGAYDDKRARVSSTARWREALRWIGGGTRVLDKKHEGLSRVCRASD